MDSIDSDGIFLVRFFIGGFFLLAFCLWARHIYHAGSENEIAQNLRGSYLVHPFRLAKAGRQRIQIKAQGRRPDLPHQFVRTGLELDCRYHFIGLKENYLPGRDQKRLA